MVVVLAAATVSGAAPEVLVAKLPLGLKTAVSAWVPALRFGVVKRTVPRLSSVPLPRRVVPSSNETVPVGEPDELLTVAVSVTDWPKVVEPGDAVRVVTVPATVPVPLPAAISKTVPSP